MRKVKKSRTTTWEGPETRHFSEGAKTCLDSDWGPKERPTFHKGQNAARMPGPKRPVFHNWEDDLPFIYRPILLRPVLLRPILPGPISLRQHPSLPATWANFHSGFRICCSLLSSQPGRVRRWPIRLWLIRPWPGALVNILWCPQKSKQSQAHPWEW